MVFGNCGVLHCPSMEGKGYVEMTSIDADTSHDIIQGSKTQAEEGTLIILAAGDRSLFDDCHNDRVVVLHQPAPEPHAEGPEAGSRAR
ncbi:unnamed protein product [Leptidea sinapis]|uniref:Uncharacterized protein n=1 Tax=Leptidea sinapis TaxID=189913 RepID=A0A5E4Q8S4_9NEOP|nr:unnamed protein product [Leptidea sinapis]